VEKAFLSRLLSLLGVEENDVSYVDGLAVKIDGSAASTSKLPFQTWEDFGWKNVAAAYSDMRVKLAEARFLLASVTAPDITTAEEIIAGIKAAADRLSLLYVGGDLNQGAEAVVDIALVGWAGRRVGRVPRPGDVLVTIPEFGFTSLAYRFWREESPAVRRGVEMLRRPTPLWPLPPIDCITASMDSSDGLGDVLWSMARGVDIIINRLPTVEEVERFAAEKGLDIDEVVFNGGEEYLPVFAIRRDCPVEGPYIKFAEVVEGNGVVWWRGQPLRWRGWSYF
jgi:Thiamine monophosphate kinase